MHRDWRDFMKVKRSLALLVLGLLLSGIVLGFSQKIGFYLGVDAVIIVTGCFSQINPEKALKIDGVDFVCGNNAKSIIAKKALELYEKKCEPHMYVPDIFNCKFDVMKVGAPLTRTRA